MTKAIIFSNNNPEGLDFFLRSFYNETSNSLNINILYNSDDENIDKYFDVFERFSIVANATTMITSFKEDLLNIINKGNEEFVVFFKDTNMFINNFNLKDIEKIMTDDDIFCFSLSLGKNITFDYYNNSANVLYNEESNSINTIKWNWIKHYLSFGRPLELGGGHIFHKKEIYKLFKKWNYSDIQSLEESFENLDYYPKEFMSSYDNNVLIDIIKETDNEININFKDLNTNVIKI